MASFVGRGRARSFIRLCWVVAVALVVLYAYALLGPPWASLSNAAGYAIVMAFPAIVIIFMENMIPRSLSLSTQGIDFQYLLSRRHVDWRLVSIPTQQRDGWLGLVTIEERIPGKPLARFHRVTADQARALSHFRSGSASK